MDLNRSPEGYRFTPDSRVVIPDLLRIEAQRLRDRVAWLERAANELDAEEFLTGPHEMVLWQLVTEALFDHKGK